MMEPGSCAFVSFLELERGRGFESFGSVVAFACRTGRFRLAIPFLRLSFFLASYSFVALRSD